MMPSLDPLPALDFDHLERQTFGDEQLARDLLVLFDRQCQLLVPLIGARSTSREGADAAHGLTGAARAVGATLVAALAAEIEASIERGVGSAEVGALFRSLAAAAEEVRAAVAIRLRHGAALDPFRLAKPDRVA